MTIALLLILLVCFLIFANMIFARLAVIHALSNSGKGAALKTAVLALTSDAISKHQLASIIGGKPQIEASAAADQALKSAQVLLDEHNKGQHIADSVGR